MASRRVRKTIDLQELVAILEELNRKANNAMQIHQADKTAFGRLEESRYHLGRHDGYSDAVALLQALLDWSAETDA